MNDTFFCHSCIPAYFHKAFDILIGDTLYIFYKRIDFRCWNDGNAIVINPFKCLAIQFIPICLKAFGQVFMILQNNIVTDINDIISEFFYKIVINDIL